jgi:ferrous iron transport protein A
MAGEIKLSELTAGSSAVVRGYPKSGGAFLRLREMGVLPGTGVTLVRTAPLGDPIEIKVRGYLLTLRKSEAEHVLVEPVAARQAAEKPQ